MTRRLVYPPLEGSETSEARSWVDATRRRVASSGRAAGGGDGLSSPTMPQVKEPPPHPPPLPPPSTRARPPPPPAGKQTATIFIASAMVAHSDPDGYTIFIVGPGLATNQFLYPQLTYDSVNDFAPVTMLITQPNLMCVPNSSPAKSVPEFIAYCHANKGKVTFASSGNGTTLHLSGEVFN